MVALLMISLVATSVMAEDVQEGMSDIGDAEVQDGGDYTATWVYLALLFVFGLLTFVGGYIYDKAGDN